MQIDPTTENTLTRAGIWRTSASALGSPTGRL